MEVKPWLFLGKSSDHEISLICKLELVHTDVNTIFPSLIILRIIEVDIKP